MQRKARFAVWALSLPATGCAQIGWGIAAPIDKRQRLIALCNMALDQVKQLGCYAFDKFYAAYVGDAHGWKFGAARAS